MRPANTVCAPLLSTVLLMSFGVGIAPAVAVPARAEAPSAPISQTDTDPAAAAQSEGDRLLRAGKVAEAAKHYLRAAQAAPGEPLYQITSGVALASVGKMDAALEAFRQAQRLTGGDDQVVALLLQGVVAERTVAGANSQQSVSLQRARPEMAFERSTILTPAAPAAVPPQNNTPVFASPQGSNGGFGGGFAAAGTPYAAAKNGGVASDRYTSASLSRLEQAAVRFPDSPVIFLLLGDANQLAQRWGAADVDYRKAVSLAPKWSKPRVNLGLSLLAQGRSAEAIRMFKSALALDPGDTQAQLGKGDAELRSGKADDAFLSYNNVAKSSNNQVAAQAATGIGEVYAKTGQYGYAVQSFNRAKALDPNDPAPVAALGEAQFLAGDYSGATASYQEALRLSREGMLASSAVLYRALAETQISARDLDGAIATVQQAIAQEPMSSPLWYRLWAQALFQKGDAAGGERQLKRALEAEGSRYPLDALNALDAHGLIPKVTTDYSAALDAARVPDEQMRILRALAHLARFRRNTADEIRWRERLIQVHPSGLDWYALAETYDLRANDPASARGAYTQALGFGDLSTAARQQAQVRLAALAAPR